VHPSQPWIVILTEPTAHEHTAVKYTIPNSITLLYTQLGMFLSASSLNNMDDAGHKMCISFCKGKDTSYISV